MLAVLISAAERRVPLTLSALLIVDGNVGGDVGG